MKDGLPLGRRARHRRGVAIAPLVLAALVAGCAEPSGSVGDYRLKIRHSVRDAQSAAATADLTARQLLRGRATVAFADVVVSDAEQDASSVQSTFDSRQPPAPFAEADALKQRADTALQDTAASLTELRIATRRDDHRGISLALEDLHRAQDELAAVPS